VAVELGLGRGENGAEVVIIKGRIDDLVAVILQVARLDAARVRVPAVEEQDFHVVILCDGCRWPSRGGEEAILVK
jgi:hypothetical protein